MVAGFAKLQWFQVQTRVATVWVDKIWSAQNSLPEERGTEAISIRGVGAASLLCVRRDTGTQRTIGCELGAKIIWYHHDGTGLINC